MGLHVENHGAEGPPLLLIHGFGASGFTWRRWLPELVRTYRVSVVDLKGCGRSPKPRDQRYSPHDLADGIVRLIRERDLRNLSLVGHSLGGGVALLTALRLLDSGAGDRIRSLVLIASAAYPQRLPPFITAARLPALGVACLTLLPIHWIVGFMLRAIVFDSTVVSQEMVGGYAEPLSHRDGRYGLLETAREIVPPDLARLTARFSEIDLPAYLLWGDSDRVVPPWVGERLSRTLPRARLDVLPGCGHLPQEELPAESLARVTDFLAQV